MAKAPNASFESILDTPADEVERPQPWPAGIYDGIVKGMYEEGKSSKKGTPFVRFTYIPTAAGEDVDQEQLTAFLDGESLGERSIKDTYYTTPDSLFRLTDALECMGIDLEGKSVRAALAETPNATVRMVIFHETSDDGEQVFSRVKRLLKIED